MKYGAFEKKLEKELLKWFNERNFQLMPETNQWNFYKQEEIYVDYVLIGKGNQWRPNMNCIGLNYSRKLNLLEELFKEYKNDKSDFNFTFCFIPNDENKADIKRKCFSPELKNDVELAMHYVVSNISNLINPEMDRLSDVKVLNALENKTIEHNGLVYGNDMWLRKLALAWAAQDPIYEEIYKYVNEIDERAIALNDDNKETYIKDSIAFKQLYAKLNSLPKFETTLLI